MVWVDDPFELFQLHIQGSGKIRLPDGQIISVSFAQSNGRPFKSISRFLLDHGRIAGRDMAYQNIKNYLREHPEECAEIFNFNERYIFFQRVENGPMGALQISVTSGRSIATDPDFFPKGALAFMKAQKPQLDPGGKVQAWVPFSRFVLNQDAGAAIKGPGRIDLFYGDGPEAEQLAGSLKEKGILYFLVKKKVKSSPIGNSLTNR
jgi:membrane-bound lytic murein transglycosylase A